MQSVKGSKTVPGRDPQAFISKGSASMWCGSTSFAHGRRECGATQRRRVWEETPDRRRNTEKTRTGELDIGPRKIESRRKEVKDS